MVVALDSREAAGGPGTPWGPAGPPADRLDDLRAALLRLDLRLRLAVDGLREELAERARDPLRGLVISDADVDALLAATPPAEAARRLLSRPAAAVAPRLADLARRFDLDAVEQEAVLICLAPALDLRYERLYAYLQDDANRRAPSVDLVVRLLAPSFERAVAIRQALSPTGRLLRDTVLAYGEAPAGSSSLLARPLHLDERIVAFLLGSGELDARLGDGVSLYPPADTAAPEVEGGVVADLAGLLAAGADDAGRPIVYLQGPALAAKRATARAACAAAGRPLLLVDLDALPAAAEHLPALAAREARLQGAVLALVGLDGLLREGPEAAALRAAWRRALAPLPAPLLLLGESRWEPAAWFPAAVTVRLELPPLSPAARADLWRRQFAGHLAPEEAADLAARYRLDGEAIRAVAAAAQGRAALRGTDRLDVDDARAAARAIAAPPLEGVTRHLESRYTWDDIVLPADGLATLRELGARLHHRGRVLDEWGYGRKHARRAGLTALFAGPPGTGKTMAAEIIAGNLGLDLYRIDLAAVVSKYIGETEKNLERIFRAADQGDAVLLFDEADALFGKRSDVRDAHDRYANVEVAYLLQRLEAYDGLAILTTNLRGSIDEAFLRRLDTVLEFPLPEEPERLAIWRRALPAEAPLADDVDLPFLARAFKLAGGHIRNMALAAAYLAAAEGGEIGMRHLVRAVRREYQKLGKLATAAEFGRYYGLLSAGQPAPPIRTP